MTFQQLFDAVMKVGSLDIVGADLNELSPMLDASGASTAAALKILRELLLRLESKYLTAKSC